MNVAKPLALRKLELYQLFDNSQKSLRHGRHNVSKVEHFPLFGYYT